MKWLGLAAMCVLAAGCGDNVGDSVGSSGQPAHPGEQTYNRFCLSCHAAGIAGAPKVGSAEAWAPRVAQGRDVLLQRTIEGIAPGMPARGLCRSCSDEQLADAIDYMLSRSQ